MRLLVDIFSQWTSTAIEESLQLLDILGKYQRQIRSCELSLRPGRARSFTVNGVIGNSGYGCMPRLNQKESLKSLQDQTTKWHWSQHLC